MKFPNIDPTAFEIFGVGIKWYGISYALGLLLALWYAKKIAKKSAAVEVKVLDDVLIWTAFGIIIGGRLGYVIFYDLVYYLQNFHLIIIGIRNGGMSFHGGLIGVIIFSFLYSKIKKIKFLTLMDIISCVAPIGLFLGRIANFINSELWGKETNLVIGIVFPNGGPNPRHPTQIYEAFLEGLILFFIINIIYNKKFNTPGYTSCIFLILYGFFRIFAEIFREPDPHIGYIMQPFLTLGILLSIPMILLGLIILYYLNEQNRTNTKTKY